MPVKISVVVPVYNTVKYLQRCVDSILNQTFKEFEVLLIDDGSSDGSERLCDKLASTDKRIRVIHQSNSGVSVARNNGIESAAGEYLLFVDSDDYLERDMIKSLIYNTTHNNADLCMCGYKRVFSSENQDVLEKEGIYDIEGIRALMKKWKLDPIIGSPCNKLFNMSILNKYNIRFIPEIKYAEDYMFNVEYLKHISNLYVVEKPFYNYYMETPGSLSKTNFTDIDALWNVQLLVLQKVSGYLNSIEVSDTGVISEIFCYMFVVNICNRAKQKSKDDFINWCKEIRKTERYMQMLKRKAYITRLKAINLRYFMIKLAFKIGNFSLLYYLFSLI